VAGDGAPDDRLADLRGLLARFESPDFVFGRWEGGERGADGSITMPYFSMSKEAFELFGVVGKYAPLDATFNWGAWGQTAEGQALIHDREALSRATREELRRLLTLCIRSDRFVEGQLEAHFQSGLLTAILRRLLAIEQELGG
jgi:hypothetical protein